MITSLGLTLLACVPLFGPVLGAGVQEPARRAAGGQERGASALERWERMSKQEREVLRARFEELRRLSPEERAALEERHRGVKSMRERVHGQLSPEVRRKLEQLEPEQRRDFLREELVEEARGRGARIREKLPREFERELEAAPAERRPQMLENFLRRQYEHRAERRLNHLAKQLELPDAERQRIAALPPREQRRELSRLEKERVVRMADTKGAPPPGMQASEWERLRQLPPEAFLDEMMRRRVFEGPHASPRGDGEAREPSLNKAARQRLFRLLRPDATERMEFARMPRAERERHVLERVSERALEFLEREALVEPAELERLRGLSGQERMRALRELVRERRAPHSGPHGRERPRDPRRRDGPDGPPEPGARGRPDRNEGPGERLRGPAGGPPPASHKGGRPERGGEQRRDASGRGRTEPR